MSDNYFDGEADAKDAGEEYEDEDYEGGEIKDNMNSFQPKANAKQVQNDHYDLEYDVNDTDQNEVSGKHQVEPPKLQKNVDLGGNKGKYDDDDDDVYAKPKSQSPTKPASNPGFDISQFYNLNVRPDAKELLGFMNRFKPVEVTLDSKLKPFIPSYIPAIGEVDAFLKVNRPDNLPEELGLTVLDEPILNGTDSSIFSLELAYRTKQKKPQNQIIVSKVDNAEKNPKLIQNWIEKVNDLHKKKLASAVSYTKQMPDIESLMQVWPEKLESLFKEIDFPDENINMNLNDYARLICNMLDVPIHKLNTNNSTIEALHVIFTLYSEFKDNPHFHRGNSNKIDNFHVQSMKFE